MRKVRFLNTYEPVVPLYKDLLPEMRHRGVEAISVISRIRYRGGRAPEGVPSYLENCIRIPGIEHKRLRGKFNPLVYALGCSGATLLGDGVDLNVFLTQPPLFFLWGLVLRKLRAQRYVIVMMDMYPWVAMEAGVIKRGSLIGWSLGKLALHVLRRADRIVSIGRCMTDALTKRGVSPGKVSFIPNWCNLNDVEPVGRERNRLRESLNLRDAFVVMYSGNFGRSHQFKDMIEVAERVRNDTGVVFVFVGAGKALPEVLEEKSKRKLENCMFLPTQPYSRLSESLGLADLHFVSLKAGFEGLMVPSKAYGVMAAGRPMVYQGERQGEVARMIEENSIGWVVTSGDVDGLERTIRMCAGDRTMCDEVGKRARHIAEIDYSPEVRVRQYCDVIESVIDSAEQ